MTEPVDQRQYHFIPHPDAERFDAVTVETVERWKESELSGDEWRFSYVATFWSHGQAITRVGGGSVEEALPRQSTGTLRWPAASTATSGTCAASPAALCHGR